MWELLATYIAIGLFLVLSRNGRGAINEAFSEVDTDGKPPWKVNAFLLLVYCISVLLWPFYLRSLLEKPKSASDAVNEFGMAIIPSAFRSIAEKRGEPLPISLSDQQIFAFYKQASTAFQETSLEKNDFLSAGVLNSIIYEMLQEVAIYGADYFPRLLERELKNYQENGVSPAFSNDPISLISSHEESETGSSVGLQSKTEAIAGRCAKLIELVEKASETKIKTDVTRWNLDDPLLLKYIGYVVGIFDAGTECTYGKNSSNHFLVVETLFHNWVKKNLSDIPLVSKFLEFHADTLAREGNTIGALMDKQDFLIAMVKGGRNMVAICHATDQNQVTKAVGDVLSDLLEFGLVAHTQEAEEGSSQSADRGKYFSTKSDAVDYAVDMETTGLRTEVSQDKLTGHWKVIVNGD